MSDALNPAPAAGPNAVPPKDDDGNVGAASFKGNGPIFKGELEFNETYDATVASITKQVGPNKFKPGETREQIVWGLTIDGREEDGELAWYTSFSMHEKSKLPGTLTAIGRPHPTPENPGIGKKTELVGLKCRVFVEASEKKSEKTGKPYPRITKVLPAKKKA